MASAAQIDANRVNAQASTGPTTEAGKAASSSNSTQHGLAGRVIFIQGEDPDIFHELYASLSADHCPANLTEELLVYKMTEEFWFGRRAAQLLATALDLNAKQDNSKQVALMLRYHTAAGRAFHKALEQLRATQKARLTLGIGFVSQEEVEAEPQPVPPPQPAPNGFVSQNAPKPAAPPIGFVSQTPQTLRRESPKVGRNEPCPCGSGLKFKRCCIDAGHSATRAA